MNMHVRNNWQIVILQPDFHPYVTAHHHNVPVQCRFVIDLSLPHAFQSSENLISIPQLTFPLCRLRYHFLGDWKPCALSILLIILFLSLVSDFALTLLYREGIRVGFVTTIALVSFKYQPILELLYRRSYLRLLTLLSHSLNLVKLTIGSSHTGLSSA
jgi:hypothetical protein